MIKVKKKPLKFYNYGKEMWLKRKGKRKKRKIIMASRTGRAKPMTAKAGVTKTKRRYACGGKMKK